MTFPSPARLLVLAVALHRPLSAAGSRLNAVPKRSPVAVPRSLAGGSSKTSSAADREAVASILNAEFFAGSISDVRRTAREAARDFIRRGPDPKWIRHPKWIASWAKPMPRCVENTNRTLTKLERAYGMPQVPSVLAHSCDDPRVNKDIGGTRERCIPLMQDLGRIYGKCGDQNYYLWCRNLYITTSDTVREHEKKVSTKRRASDNASADTFKGECSQRCPHIANLISDESLFTSLLMEMVMAVFEMFFNERTEELVEKVITELALVMRLENRMCDNVLQAEPRCARPSLMTPACHNFSEALEVGYDDIVGLFENCDKRQPCREACQGIDALRVDFMRDFMRVGAYPVPTTVQAYAFCDTLKPVKECSAKPQCKDYFDPDDYETSSAKQPDFKKSVENFDFEIIEQRMCTDIFLDGCYATQEKKCKKELDKFQDMKDIQDADQYRHCGEVIRAHDSEEIEWDSNWEEVRRPAVSDANLTHCCQVTLNLAECNARNYCQDFMRRELNFTDLLEHYEHVCPQVLWALTTTTTPLPFDCQAGLINWESGWSVDKKEWCCANENKGCGLFDCQAGLSNWARGWSDEKKGWCCEQEGLGCTTTPAPDPFDCLAGLNNWNEGWSGKKKDWCCANKNLGCPGQPSPGVGHKSPLV